MPSRTKSLKTIIIIIITIIITSLCCCPAVGRQINTGAYIIDYHKGCGTSPSLAITHDQAQAECKITTADGRGGPDWDLATIPSFEVFAQLRDAFSGEVHIGAIYDSSDSKWKWQYGRLAGVEIWQGMSTGSCLATSYKFPTYINNTSPYNCAFALGEPSGPGYCTTITGQIGNRTMRSRGCSGKYCYLCSRTLCTMGTDCYTDHTATMHGTNYPNCVCNCKAGFWGNKCQYPMAYDHGSNRYVSELATQCTSGDYPMAVAACKTLGTGWALATFPSQSSLSFYKQMMRVGGVYTTTFIGASGVAVKGRWLWTAGRLRDIQFWQGGTCIPHTFQSFLPEATFTPCGLWMATPQPDNSGDNCAVLNATDQSMLMGAVKCDATYPCFTCERSPCKIGVDCFGPNTISVANSYFPDCTCTCQPWAWGKKCQFSTGFDHGANLYVSDDCASDCHPNNTASLNTERDSTGNCSCKCKKGFHGNRCEHMSEPRIPCKYGYDALDCHPNKTTNMNPDHDSTGNCGCVCKPGYYGKNCEESYQFSWFSVIVTGLTIALVALWGLLEAKNKKTTKEAVAKFVILSSATVAKLAGGLHVAAQNQNITIRITRLFGNGDNLNIEFPINRSVSAAQLIIDATKKLEGKLPESPLWGSKWYFYLDKEHQKKIRLDVGFNLFKSLASLGIDEISIVHVDVANG